MRDYKIQFDLNLNERQKTDWNEFWSVSRHAFPRQHYLYEPIEKAINETPIYISGRLEGRVAFVGLFCVKPIWGTPYSFEAVCLRGPVFDDIHFGEWCLKELIQYFTQRGVGSVRIGPRWTFPEAEGVESMLFNNGFKIYEKWHDAGHRSTGIIRLDRTEEELLMSFEKSTRYEIRHAERLKISVSPVEDYPQAEIFYKELKRMHIKRGLTCYTEQEFQSLFFHVLKNRDLGAIFNAYSSNNEFLGGILLVRDSYTAYTVKFVVLNEVTKKFSNIRLAPVVFWHGMRWARDKGCTNLDLVGYSSDLATSGHLQLIYKYKRGFNPLEIKLLGQYYIPCHKGLYTAHKAFTTILDISKKPMRVFFLIKTGIIKEKIKRAKDSHPS